MGCRLPVWFLTLDEAETLAVHFQDMRSAGEPVLHYAGAINLPPMCGRYTLTADGADIWNLIEGALPVRDGLSQEQVSLVLQVPGRRKYNIVLTSYEPIIYSHEGKTVIAPAFWWLLPCQWRSKSVPLGAKGVDSGLSSILTPEKT